MSKIFFYGLFMDQTLLAGKGLHPKGVGPAVLPGHRIHIGERATLVPDARSRAYGIVMELDDEEARTLYAEPSVSVYIPERVQAELLDTGETIEADCYNLPQDMAGAGTNPAYATRLAQLADSLEFDPAYLREIRAFAAPGFCVLYQWKLREGSESAFQQAWEDVTEYIRKHRAGLGSRLHRMEDGWWCAYAQWPERARWEESQELGFGLPEAGKIMADAIVERRDPVLMDVVADRL